MLRLSDAARAPVRWLVISALAGHLVAVVPDDDIPARFEAQQHERLYQLEREHAVFIYAVRSTMVALGLRDGESIQHSHCTINRRRGGVIRISDECRRNALAKECM